MCCSGKQGTAGLTGVVTKSLARWLVDTGFESRYRLPSRAGFLLRNEGTILFNDAL